jgi:hypothetical protein
MSDHRTVRIIRHDESFEVRVSTYFYFTADKSRRDVTKRPTPEQAEEAAKDLARKERG